MHSPMLQTTLEIRVLGISDSLGEGLLHLWELFLVHRTFYALRTQSSVGLQRHGSSIHGSRVAGKAPRLLVPA